MNYSIKQNSSKLFYQGACGSVALGDERESSQLQLISRTIKQWCVSIAVALSLAGVVQAQENATSEIEEVLVKGIRGSLLQSLNVKRDSHGIVDAITSEDIGKFPDTNLAESMQRLTGVSIDRQNGEGSRVTVRGIGPDYNLVLLNGRQMPVSQNGASASSSRSFDFANLASESVRSVEVYKTSRAAIPTGGLGATVNIKTAKPLDSPDLLLNIGGKLVNDESFNNRGSSYTPELSVIYSQKFADDTIGVGVNVIMQQRDFGAARAGVNNGWRSFQRGGDSGWGTLPQSGTGLDNITNPPQAGDVYSVPQNVRYGIEDQERERMNGQLILQYKPLDNLTATLDYTVSEFSINTQLNELGAWFNYGPNVTGNGGASRFSEGSIASALVFSEDHASGGHIADIAMAGAINASKNENTSLGLNVDWQMNDRLGFALDYHTSSAESRPDGIYGNTGSMASTVFDRAITVVNYTNDIPVLTLGLNPNANNLLQSSRANTSGSVFHNGTTINEIDQLKLSGNFELSGNYSLDFGLTQTTMNNRSAYGNVQRNTWNGVGAPADYPDGLWTLDSMRNYITEFSGINHPNMFHHFLRWDFAAIANHIGATANLNSTISGDNNVSAQYPCGGQRLCAPTV